MVEVFLKNRTFSFHGVGWHNRVPCWHGCANPSVSENPDFFTVSSTYKYTNGPQTPKPNYMKCN